MLPESSDELKNPYEEYYRYLKYFLNIPFVASLKSLVFVFTKSDV